MTGKIAWLLDESHSLPLTEARVAIDGMDLFYRTGGVGPPLLLLHGMTRTGRFWLPYVDALGKHYTVIVPDLPGHGNSTGLPGDLSFRRMARQVWHFLDALGVERIRTAGHSLGATLSLLMGIDRPDRVEAMVILGGAHRQSGWGRDWAKGIWWESIGQGWQTLLRREHPRGDDQIRQLLAQLRGFADNHEGEMSPEELATIRARTLLVCGDRDPTVPVEFAVEMYRAIPNAALWVVPDEMHEAGMAPSKETFLTTMIGFLGQDVPG